MGIIKGLKQINEYETKQAQIRDEMSNKVSWLSLKDGERVRVRFLQEFDADSPNYSTKQQQALLAIEHSNPDDFKRKALCTADEGECYGCEQVSAGVKGGPDGKKTWRASTKMYVNLFVDNGKDEPSVKVLSQGMGPKGITPFILEYLQDNDSVTDKWWTLKRTGGGFNDTSYTLTPGKPLGVEDASTDSFELFDLEKSAVKNIPYGDQEAFYHGGIASKPKAATVSTDDSW